MPTATILMGTPSYKPVMVRKPRSDSRTNGGGWADSRIARLLAREGGPTVIYNTVSYVGDMSR
jgi:hypothetical protein